MNEQCWFPWYSGQLDSGWALEWSSDIWRHRRWWCGLMVSKDAKQSWERNEVFCFFFFHLNTVYPVKNSTSIQGNVSVSVTATAVCLLQWQMSITEDRGTWGMSFCICHDTTSFRTWCIHCSDSFTRSKAILSILSVNICTDSKLITDRWCPVSSLIILEMPKNIQPTITVFISFSDPKEKMHSNASPQMF